MKLLQKYFTEIDSSKVSTFSNAIELYKYWNEKINVISRKDIDEIEEKHFLHSLAIAKVFNFEKSTEILDFGTGGGFPGIPMAIFFPDVQFNLIDSISKKTMVVKEIAKELRLDNVNVLTGRVEDLNIKVDFVTCRAVGKIGKIMPWVRTALKKESINSFSNGYIFLKGGDLSEELEASPLPFERIPIAKFFEESFFETKEIVYLPKQIKIKKHV